MSDEIIREIWQIKDAISREANYNLRSLGDLLRKRQSKGTRKVVDLSSRRKAAMDKNPAASGRTSQST